MMKIEEIESVARIMSEYDLSEFKLESEGVNISMRRGGKTVVAPGAVPVAVAPAPAAVPVPPTVAVPAAPVPPTENRETIDAPIVGTFYRASSPDSPSFVSVGDKVNADTVVAIIEAMKVMNEIKAEKSGVIKEILVENGSPVEYGQPLFVIG